LRERVLHDAVLRLRGAELAAQVGDLRHVEPLLVDEDRAVRSLDGGFQLLELRLFVRPGDSHQCFTAASIAVVSMRTPGPIVDDTVTLLKYLPFAAAGFAF